MATARDIKKRIRSVKNISQITRALEAVSASRVRKAQARVLASRAFAEKAWEILLNVQSTATKGLPLHPLLASRDEIKNIMVVVLTSDRGLAGAYNTNIIRVAERFAHRMGKPTRFVTVGKKARDSFIRGGKNVVAEFSGLPADPTIASISPVARLAIDEFLAGTVDQVFIAYTDFVNTLTQRPGVLGWLPLVPYSTDDQVMAEMVKDVPAVSAGKSDYDYEPDAAAILDEIVPRFTELQIYQALLESQASEHSARMVAMRNASDNATQLMGDLTLVYNKARQAAITAEILDIVGGAEALQASIEGLADEILASQPQNGNGAHAMMSPPVVAKAGGRVSLKGGSGDDLTVIEGIGPKMSAALVAAGIDTYVKLAASDEAALLKAIEAAGMRLAPALPSWPEQAALAAAGDWDGLERLQDQLTAGRKA